MTNPHLQHTAPKDACLTSDDLYRYIAGSLDRKAAQSFELHLSECPRCRGDLSDLLALLHPDDTGVESASLEPSRSQIEETLATIRVVAENEGKQKQRRYGWTTWGVAAAAAVALLISGALGFKYFYEKITSEQFYAEAKVELERNYAENSPSGLRLNLPFRSTAVRREIEAGESLHRAENLFYQALAVREGMFESHLGLGAVYLTESKFEKSLSEFQQALKAQKNHPQALMGSGVVKFELARQSDDPSKRILMLNGSLNDFNSILASHPDSAEGRYNKILVLFEAGRHQEAEREIDSYLARDSGSIWAKRLRELKSRISLVGPNKLKIEVDRATTGRDADTLMLLAQFAPEQAAKAIRYSLSQSLLDPSAESSAPTAADRVWAANVMESAYAAATGDPSYRRLLRFYGGLSPPQRLLKQSLDRRFLKLVELHMRGNLASALRDSTALLPEYLNLRDYWKLRELHLLRGNSLYYGKGDFRGALAEYRRMFDFAELCAAADLKAEALGALAVAYDEQHDFDQALACATEMRELSQKHHFGAWTAYAAHTLSGIYLNLNRLDEAIRESSLALRLAVPLREESVWVGTLEHLGAALDRSGRLSEANNFYRLALEQQDDFVREGSVKADSAVLFRRLNLLHKQGVLALRMNDLAAAEACFKAGLEQAPAGMRAIATQHRLGLAEIELERRHFDKAAVEIAQSSTVATSGNYLELRWQAKSLQGRLLSLQGRFPEALQSFDAAVEVLDQMRHKVTPGELRQSFLTHRFDPYKETVGLLYNKLNMKDRALEYVERSRSMTLAEDLMKGNPGQEPSFGSPDIASAIGPFASLEFFFGADELFAFVSGPGGMEASSAVAYSGDLKEEIRKFVESVRDGDQFTFRVLARKLYDELILPVERALQSHRSETLIIIPDGPLHFLPFSGLMDAEGQFLVERHVLTYAPSQKVFRYCCSLNRGSAASHNRRILLMDGTTNLTNAGNELAYLADLYGLNATLLGARNLSLAARMAAQSEIMHFAGHAVTTDDRMNLVFQLSPREKLLDSKTIATWALPKARLVNLAGCNTGLGPQGEGEAPWGLIPAFLSAGAPAVIASLMPVDDAATEHLFRRFYALLVDGSIGKARALQSAQIAALASARSSGNLNPITWVPYVLVGDPR